MIKNEMTSGQDQLKAAGEAIDVPRASRDALHQEHMQFAKAIVHKKTETHHDGFGLETGNDWDEAAAGRQEEELAASQKEDDGIGG